MSVLTHMRNAIVISFLDMPMTNNPKGYAERYALALAPYVALKD